MIYEREIRKGTRSTLHGESVTHTISTGVSERFAASECYGDVLSISCKPGHRIKVLDDFFGVSTRLTSSYLPGGSHTGGGENRCQYQPGDCTLTNSRHTSVVHRYCEGKQTCHSFQVDRRRCGHNQTNYEQVEYECVPGKQLVTSRFLLFLVQQEGRSITFV